MKSYFFILPLPGERRNTKYICGGGKLLPACLLLCENNRPFRPGHWGWGVGCWVSTRGRRKADKISLGTSRSAGCCQATCVIGHLEADSGVDFGLGLDWLTSHALVYSVKRLLSTIRCQVMFEGFSGSCVSLTGLYGSQACKHRLKKEMTSFKKPSLQRGGGGEKLGAGARLQREGLSQSLDPLFFEWKPRVCQTFCKEQIVNIRLC